MSFLVTVLKFFKALLKELFLKKNMTTLHWHEVTAVTVIQQKGMKFCLNKILISDLYSFENLLISKYEAITM